MANDRHRLGRMKEAATYEQGEGSVPLYRSYGVKRRLRPWQEKIELGVSKILLYWIMGMPCYPL